MRSSLVRAGLLSIRLDRCCSAAWRRPSWLVVRRLAAAGAAVVVVVDTAPQQGSDDLQLERAGGLELSESMLDRNRPHAGGSAS